MLAAIFNGATVRGFEWKIIGLNPRFAFYGGINVRCNAIAVFLVSGAIAGLGGAEQVLGVYKAFYDNFSPGYGFDGIAVAMLANSNPIGVIFAAFLFGALNSRQRRPADDDQCQQISRPGAPVHHRAHSRGAILAALVREPPPRRWRRRQRHPTGGERAGEIGTA